MSPYEIASLLAESRRALEGRAITYMVKEDKTGGVAKPGMWCDLCNQKVSAITDIGHDETCLISRLSEAVLYVRLEGVSAS